MNEITLVLAYYENRAMLSRHYEELRLMPKELRPFVHMIVVDDGSPKSPAKPPVVTIPVQLSIFRMSVDIRWNQDACRNLGVYHASTPWVLMTDMDHLVPITTWFDVLRRELDPECIYRFSRVSAPLRDPYKPHPNSWLMTRSKFYDAEGYDERYAGYYGTDGMFGKRAMALAKETIMLDAPLVRYPREVIPDASTTTYDRKTKEDKAGLARVKAEISALPPEERAPKRLTFPFARVYPPMEIG